MLFEWNRVLLDWINSILLINLKHINDLRNGRIFGDLIHYLTNENETIVEFLPKEYPKLKRAVDIASLENPGDEVLVASLLLHYTCIKVKDSLIRISMCENLSISNQKAITQFIDSLMNHEDITEDNLMSALGAFNNNIHSKELNMSISTPIKSSFSNNPSPMLDKLLQYPIVTPTTQKSRKIFRLEAELEAERYDRNFLQEDVNRKHRRIFELEKLQKSHIDEIQRLREELAENEENKAKSNKNETCHQCLAKEKVLQEQYRSQELEIHRLLSNSLTIEEERDSLKDKANNLEKDLKKWQIHAIEIERNLHLSNTQVDQYKLEIISLKTALADTTQCLHEYRQQSMNVSVECDDDVVSKRNFNLSLNSTPENLGKAIVDIQLKEQLNNKHLLMDQSILVDEEKHILMQQIQNHLEKIDYLEKKWNVKNVEVDEQYKENSMIIATQQATIEELEKIISSLKCEILVLKEKNEKYQNEVCEKANQIQILLEKLQDAKIKISTKNIIPLVDYDKMLQEKIKLCSDLEQKEVELSELKKFHKKTIEQVPNLGNEKNKYENKLIRMKQKIFRVLPSISIITLYHLIWYFYLDFRYHFSYSKC